MHLSFRPEISQRPCQTVKGLREVLVLQNGEEFHGVLDGIYFAQLVATLAAVCGCDIQNAITLKLASQSSS